MSNFQITETDQNIVWYAEALEDRGVSIVKIDSITVGRHVMASDEGNKKYIEESFDYDLIREEGNIKLYYIKSKIQ